MSLLPILPRQRGPAPRSSPARTPPPASRQPPPPLARSPIPPTAGRRPAPPQTSTTGQVNPLILSAGIPNPLPLEQMREQIEKRLTDMAKAILQGKLPFRLSMTFPHVCWFAIITILLIFSGLLLSKPGPQASAKLDGISVYGLTRPQIAEMAAERLKHRMKNLVLRGPQDVPLARTLTLDSYTIAELTQPSASRAYLHGREQDLLARIRSRFTPGAEFPLIAPDVSHQVLEGPLAVLAAHVPKATGPRVRGGKDGLEMIPGWTPRNAAQLAEELHTKLALPVENGPPDLAMGVIGPPPDWPEKPILWKRSQTPILTTNEGSRQNMVRAAGEVDGLLLLPGQVASINQILGRRTQEKGYVLGGALGADGPEQQVGGGICQVSTTLYVLALDIGERQGFPVIERWPHSRVCRYSPGRDATLNWPNKDLKIKNNFNVPLAMRVYVRQHGKRSFMVAELWGPERDSPAVRQADPQSANTIATSVLTSGNNP